MRRTLIFFLLLVLTEVAIPQNDLLYLNLQSADYIFSNEFMMSDPLFTQASTVAFINGYNQKKYYTYDEENEQVRTLFKDDRSGFTFGVNSFFGENIKVSNFSIGYYGFLSSEELEKQGGYWKAIIDANPIGIFVTLPYIQKRAFADIPEFTSGAGFGDVFISVRLPVPLQAIIPNKLGISIPTATQVDGNNSTLPLGNNSVSYFIGWEMNFPVTKEFSLGPEFTIFIPKQKFENVYKDNYTSNEVKFETGLAPNDNKISLFDNYTISLTSKYQSDYFTLFAVPQYTRFGNRKVSTKVWLNGEEISKYEREIAFEQNVSIWVGGSVALPFDLGPLALPYLKASARIPIYGNQGTIFSVGLDILFKDF